MITPINFELAKLLNEKGLPGIIGFYDNEKHYDLNPKKYTIADIINWLLENHSIWISVLCDVGQDKLFTFKIYSTKIGNEKCLAFLFGFATVIVSICFIILHFVK